jgi:hypothetical protein
MKKFLAVSLSVLSLASAAPALAATFPVPDGEHFSITVPLNDDVYTAAGVLRVEENIAGDLVIAGGDVTISGNVQEDVIAAGGSVTIEGNVGDDVRSAGGDVSIEGNVTGDVIVFGGQLMIGENAVIQGDLIAAGGMVQVLGAVRGKLDVSGGEVILRGPVEGATKIKGDRVRLDGILNDDTIIIADTITIGENGLIGGNLTYWTAKGIDDRLETATRGTATFDPELRPYDGKGEMHSKSVIAFFVAAIFGYGLLAASLFIIVTMLLTKKYFGESVKYAMKKPWVCVGYGLVFFVVTPILGVLLMITIIGIPLGASVFALYGFSIVFALPLTAIVAAKWCEIKYKKKWNKVAFFFVAVGVYLILKIVGFIPIIGWIAVMLAVLLAFGAMLQAKIALWKKYA